MSIIFFGVFEVVAPHRVKIGTCPYCHFAGIFVHQCCIYFTLVLKTKTVESLSRLVDKSLLDKNARASTSIRLEFGSFIHCIGLLAHTSHPAIDQLLVLPLQSTGAIFGHVQL